MTTTPTSVYRTELQRALRQELTFEAIIRHHVARFQAMGNQDVFNSLASGTAIIQTAEQASTYLAAYGDMHRLKLESAFEQLFASFDTQRGDIDVVDWGCGQGLASAVLIDYLRQHRPGLAIRSATLIEPSALALNRGVDHLELLLPGSTTTITAINRMADQLPLRSVETDPGLTKIHLFSNLLDMPTVDYAAIARYIKVSQRGQNRFVCVSPLLFNGQRDGRLGLFQQQFTAARTTSVRTNPLVGNVFGIRAMRPARRIIHRNEHLFTVQL